MHAFNRAAFIMARSTDDNANKRPRFRIRLVDGLFQGHRLLESIKLLQGRSSKSKAGYRECR